MQNYGSWPLREENYLDFLSAYVPTVKQPPYKQDGCFCFGCLGLVPGRQESRYYTRFIHKAIQYPCE
jgi:hypothetical protein